MKNHAWRESGRSFRSVDYNGGVALVLGSEAHGLGDDWRAAAAFTVSVPMLGRVDSLNVSTTAALLLYEVLRWRGTA